MGKSSAYLKKKRSKDSSKSRSRKKSKSKGRRNKSRKLRRGEDSVSYSDDSHSRSSVSVSSSSSEDGHRSRRSQSRTRRDVKGSKKRPRRPSYSNESREEASSRLRKRRGSKRNDEYEGRKRSHPKKKLRRDVSISSKSSESLSCSTCRGGNSSDKSEFERKRGRSERRDKNKRRLDKVKTGNKSRDRSRSHSLSPRRHSLSPRRGVSSGYRSEEKLTGENNSRRLKSIITVIKEDNDDGNKEEIVYDHDDYPSCRSNDSNDGGSKKELACHSHVASEKKRHVEDEKGEEAVVSNIGTSRVTESSKGGENQCDGSNPSCDGFGENDAIREKSGQVSGAGDSLKGEDLESVLRQRALANLTKFRGGMQTNAKTPLNEKDKSDNNVKPPSTEEAESVQVKSAKGDGSTGGATPVSKRISMPAVREDSQNYRKVPDGNDVGKEYGSTKHNFASPRNPMAAGGLKEQVNATVSSFTNKPKLATSVWRRESSNTSTTPKQTTTPKESLQAKLMSGSSVDKSAAETAQTLTPKSGTSKDEVNNTRDSASEQTSSSLKPESGDVNSDKLRGEAKDGQFEQKTMSVMRGGEMVQVSYKVYIPKKAPALARRPLKR